MANRVSRAHFAHHKTANVALSKATDLTIDSSDVGVASRTAPFIISTEAVDRDGDTLALNGWDLDDYRANPIVLFDHNPSQPIGKSEQIWTADNALRAIAWFPSKDVSELADNIFKLIEAQVLRTASVTFLPLEFTQANDRASSSPWGMPPMNFKRQKLLEWSVVSVPSNQEALRQAKGLKVDWALYKNEIERSLDSDAPLSAPRIEYEKTHAVVKSFLQACKPKPKATENDTMKTTSKAGNVLNKDNLNRLKAAQKHMEKSDELHKSIDAIKAKAMMHMSKCAEHMKAIQDSHDAGKEVDKDDDKQDESGDAGVESDEAKKQIDEDEKENKSQDGEGSEDNINEKPTGNGSITPSVTSNLPDSEDYYREYGKKSADQKLVDRARAALRGETPKPKSETQKSVAEMDWSEEEMQYAWEKFKANAQKQHLRALRGQD